MFFGLILLGVCEIFGACALKDHEVQIAGFPFVCQMVMPHGMLHLMCISGLCHPEIRVSFMPQKWYDASSYVFPCETLTWGNIIRIKDNNDN